MWNTVLFDLDGTLTDSGEGITKSVQYALKKGFGIEASLEDLRRFVGPPLLKEFQRYAHLSEEEARRAVQLFRERYVPVGIFENRLYDGIPDMLSQLKREGFTICLSSSKPEAHCRTVLEYFHIEQYFDEIVGSAMDETRTDKAEVVAEVIRRLKEDGLYSGQGALVIVGDREYDIVGGKRNSIATIGVSYGYGSRAELEKAWPDAIADSVRELRNILIGQYRDGMRTFRGQGSGQMENRDRQGSYTDRGMRDLQEEYLSRRKETRQDPLHMSVGRRVFRAILPMIIAVAINLGISIVYEFVILTLLGGTDPNPSLNTLLMTGLMDLIILIVMAGMWKRDEALRRGLHASDQMLVRRQMDGFLYAVDIFFVLGVTLLFNLIFSRFIPTSPTYESFVDSFSSLPFAVTVALIGVLGPCAEEFLFRGVFYRRVRDYLNPYAAALLSGLAFGVFHGNLEQGIPAFVMGFLFCLVYEHFGTITASIAGHMSVNLLALIEEKVLDVTNSSTTAAGIFGTIVMMVIVAGVCSGIWMFTKDQKVNRL